MPGDRFHTTRWSVVLAAGATASPEADDALARLCETYWHPLYAFVRRQGNDPQTAQDLVQGFFARLVEKRDFAEVHPDRGRFRAFLLAAIKHYVSNEWDRERALKRGGGRRILSLDVSAAEGWYRAEAVEERTPEMLYARRWALTLLERVRAGLEEEARLGGNTAQFACLQHYLAGGGNVPYAEAAVELGMSEGAVRTAVHRLRKRFGQRLREEIAETVGSEEEIDDEIRALFAALAGSGKCSL